MGEGAWSNVTLTDEQHGVYSGVSWIQVVTAILSIIGSGSIIGYTVFQNIVKLPEIRPLFYLNLSNLLLASCWLIGGVLYRKNCHRNISCYNLQVVGQMFYISTFFYTLNYTWQSCGHMKRRINSNISKMSAIEYHIGRITTVLSSVIPVLLTAPVLFIGNIEQCYSDSTNSSKSCLILNIGSQITTDVSMYNSTVCTSLHFYGTSIFMATFCLTAISIMITLGYSYSLYRRHLTTKTPLQDQQSAGITVTRRSLILFPSIFLLCCLPAVILALVKLADDKETDSIYNILYYIQAFAAVSPGFLNCFAYGWMQQMLRCLKQNGVRDVDTQTPLLRSQKKLYATMHTAANYTDPRIVSALQ